jgi:UDP-N-acetylglucosamine--dolichyl-phosphate N-acetylglucosaminephosphotransferase
MFKTFQTVLVPGLIVFIVTLIATQFLVTYLYNAGIVAEDRNKGKAKLIAGSGGLAVAAGIVFGMLAYISGGSFNIFTPVINISQLLAVALSIMLIAMVGFLDDINVQRKRVKSTDRMDIRQGLKQWQKPLLTFVGALPLMAINAGVSTINIPFVGNVNFLIFYPLIIIPLAVIFVSNAVNLLGGFDGLQPGMTLVAGIGLLIYSIFFGTYMGTLLSSLMVAAILAFLPFNARNAKIIPGDSFTYAIGATMVAIMIMGHEEAFGVIIFIPWIIEFFLHLRRGFQVSDLGIRQGDGTLRPPYGKSIFSLTHVVMNIKKATEMDVTLYLCAFEAIFVILAFLLKFAGLL